MNPLFAPPVILAADVGGTHLNLGLLTQAASGQWRLLRKATCASRDETSLLGPLQRFLAAHPAPEPRAACIAGAGPVRGNRLALTNLPWTIDGPALARALGIPVRVINDFSALCHGVLALDPRDPAQITPVPHGDGSCPVPDPEGPVLVVGAGTGLGVGFAVPGQGGHRVFPSEGGHIGLPTWDDTSRDLGRFLTEGCGGPPGAELAVSGPGLGRLLAFLLETGRAPSSPVTEAILALPAEARPAAIPQAPQDPACARASGLFIELYARVCADLCAVLLPSGGLYLAGGITAKNPAWFLAEGRFMRSFERNYRAHLDALTRATPVFLVRDYAVSLYGAARAAALGPPSSLLMPAD